MVRLTCTFWLCATESCVHRGTTWGIDGYFELAAFDHNMCGVATTASYPQV